MKIKELEVLKVPPSWVWVRVHTDEGIVGLGEPFLESHADTVIAELRRIEPALIGEDPTRIEHLWAKMYTSGNGYVGGPIKMSAISGIDMALWDITGQYFGVPAYQLMGGRFRDRVKVYRALGDRIPHSVDPGDPYWLVEDDFDSGHDFESRAIAAAETAMEWGFRAVKLHYVLRSPFDEALETRTIVKHVECLRRHFDSALDIALDVHNPHPKLGLRLAKAVEPFSLLFLEEPIPVERIDLLQEITSATTTPIAAGERWMGKWAFQQALTYGANVLQPDIAHAGGPTELLKIAHAAESSYAWMAPHCPLSPLSLAASVQMGAAVPNFLIQEHNEVNDFRKDDRTYLGYGYFEEPFLVEDGYVNVPNRPGLGISLDTQGMKRIMEKPWFERRG